MRHLNKTIMPTAGSAKQIKIIIKIVSLGMKTHQKLV
jgi:hypothetical protein